MEALTSPLSELRETEELQAVIKNAKGIFQVTGCIDSQKLHFIYGIHNGCRRKLIVTYSEQRARELYEEYRFYDEKTLYYPAKDLLFYQADIHGNLLIKQRMQVLQSVMCGDDATIITTIDGCMDKLPPLQTYEEHILELKSDSVAEPATLAAALVQLGYERTVQVESAGQFAVRGNILDVFELTAQDPYRVEFWGDEVDSIRSFDVESQRSIENLSEIAIFPASEFVLTDEQREKGIARLKKEMKKQSGVLREQMKTEEAYRLQTTVSELCEQAAETGSGSGMDMYVRYFYPKTVSLLDYFLAAETMLFLDEPNRLKEHADAVWKEFSESLQGRMEKGYVLAGKTDVLYSVTETIARFMQYCCISVSALEPSKKYWTIKQSFFIHAQSVNSYQNDFAHLAEDLTRLKRQNYRVLLLVPSRTRAKRLAEDLREYDLNSYYAENMEHTIAPGEIMTARGAIKKGFEYPLIKFIVLTESDIFGKEQKKKKKRRSYEGTRISDFNELKVGDYVVHENHGLGIYQGIEQITVDQKTKDYIKISYRDGGNLYILATQLELIQKYSGAEGKVPKLNKLGTQEWKKTKAKVSSAVQDIAKELVELYAIRQETDGYVYGPDTVWQKEFEEMFPFEETEDQLLAIEDTKRDMESRKIMDRLICGDVGYGKTEVAIRAAFKAVQENKQVVFLVPTTILAQQHYNTFTQRLKEFPVRVDMLSRFSTPAQQKKTIEDLKRGMVDIVIGTHRVLSKDVVYKDLGLLIIDEEQRFGVTHKEKIKQMKKTVDVLTLTATPIPRTLHMSLIGIRDMSVLQEPPQDRMAIQTYVMEYEEEMVREAISRELARGGQVYYVFNRVNGIEEMAATVSKLVPDASVAFAHGQMSERELEKVMFRFINGEVDVLVSTTIIETGLDISNVNTMIIHDADRLGLSQLYQLRGRVGRSNRTAYAFLLYRRNKMLREVAEKRLQAIREFTELGSGIKIAMRDLEIRGAGSLLGARQHGHMEAVGYDLYCKMLNEAVKSMKGTVLPDTFETLVDISIDAFIPDTYIPNEFQKLDIYKRIAGIEKQEECEDMMEELTDRFGDLPQTVQNLLFIARLKTLAHSLFMTEVSEKADGVHMVMYPMADVATERIPEMLGHFKNKLVFRQDTRPCFIYKTKKKPEEREYIQLLETMGSYLKKK